MRLKKKEDWAEADPAFMSRMASRAKTRAWQMPMRAQWLKGRMSSRHDNSFEQFTGRIRAVLHVVGRGFEVYILEGLLSVVNLPVEFGASQTHVLDNQQ